MSISLLVLPLLFAHATQVAKVSELAPADGFAQEMTRLADAGYHLRDVETSEIGEQVRLALTMANSKRARKLSLVWNPEAQSFGSFAQQKSEMPTEMRNYAFEAALIEELGYGAPSALGTGCASLNVEFGPGVVSVGSEKFEVVVSRERRAAGKSLSKWLARNLEEGELVDLRDERTDNGAQVRRFVVLVVESDEGIHEVRTQINSAGKPLSFVVLHTPGQRPWRRYTGGTSLGQRLDKSGGVVSMNFADSGEFGSLSLNIELENSETISFGESDFQEEESPCGC